MSFSRTARREPRPTSAAATLCALALALVAALPARAATPIDLGDPSVLSQQGQRLRIALPYGAPPGAHVSATRFEVVSVTAPAGWSAPDPEQFTIAKPARRNLVFLQSDEKIDAPELTVAVRVSGQADGLQTWRISVPPARSAIDASGVRAASMPAAPRSASKRAARRTTPRSAMQ